MMEVKAEEADAAFGLLLTEWEGITSAPGTDTEAWERDFLLLAAEAAAIADRGRWTRGRDTLLGVLGIQHDEVRNCRALGWLLDPIAPHGLGPRMLRLFARDLIADQRLDAAVQENLSSARIRLEERRSERRADVIVYGEGWSILIEAKVLSGESHAQGEDLASAWQVENPALVFLTRDRHEMRTAGSSNWLPYTWRQFAQHLADALDDETTDRLARGRPAAEEYLRSLRRYL